LQLTNATRATPIQAGLTLQRLATFALTRTCAIAGQPVRGGTLVIAASADPGEFNPAIKWCVQ
jgi:hypothetical protein